MADKWFVKTAEGEAGPFGFSKLKVLVATGKLTAGHPIRMEAGKWVPAETISGLFPPKKLSPLARQPVAPGPIRNPSSIAYGSMLSSFLWVAVWATLIVSGLLLFGGIAGGGEHAAFAGLGCFGVLFSFVLIAFIAVVRAVEHSAYRSNQVVETLERIEHHLRENRKT